jgi:hypothetical protein
VTADSRYVIGENHLEIERLQKEIEQANTTIKRNEDHIATRQLAALTAEENRKLRHAARGGKCPK